MTSNPYLASSHCDPPTASEVEPRARGFDQLNNQYHKNMKKATHTEFQRFDDQGKLPSDKKMAPSKRKAFINVDLGEGYGNFKCGPDEELIPMIDHANIACGFQ